MRSSEVLPLPGLFGESITTNLSNATERADRSA